MLGVVCGRSRGVALGARCLSTRVPHSKMKKRNKRQHVISKFDDVNDPTLVVKNLRYAENRARAAGDVELISAFDAAASKFDNPPPLMAATLLERAAMVTRDMEDWEQAFLDFQASRLEETAKEYPKAMMERLTAGSRIKEGNTDDVGAAAAGSGLQQFYTNEGFADADVDTLDITDFRAASRETEADKINDTRSLDRALTQRLVMLVRRKADGRWWFPQGEREDGEAMVAAARRHMMDVYGSALEAWYPGSAPVGFWLNTYDEATQERSGCYGEKVFFYRAQIFRGRLDLSDEFDDFKWLSRGELVLEDLLDNKPKHYMHAVLGAGPGEEAWRRERAAAKRGGGDAAAVEE